MSRTQRVRLRLRGAVQGVGFRPFVCRLANSLGVSGWIANDAEGVLVEAEADDGTIGRFMRAIMEDGPPRAVLHELAAELIDPTGDVEFTIAHSEHGGARSAVVLPDAATCPDCLAEIRDPAQRRFGYAFTNCTNCGPRYSIIRDLPYDRATTTMAGFTMCPACAAEYGDIGDRRFHAQPIACPACGPRLALADAAGRPLPSRDPVADAAAALRAGRIVAVKGIGGYQLMADAANDEAVATLRARKHRPVRPLAVMVASLEQARTIAKVDDTAAALLCAPAAPIVLLPHRTAGTPRAGRALAAGVAPGNRRVGIMLPAAPLHHLLLAAFGRPVIATSGNLSDEPICTAEQEAFARLAGIADLFLVHDRPIERHVDDGVMDVVDDQPRILRRARGHAPMPLLLRRAVPAILAVGAQLKNALALSRGRRVFISQHIGDLETLEAQRAFERAAADLLRLYDVEPQAIAYDLHPDYAATRWAEDECRRRGVPGIAVQHHHAHLVACMAENDETRRTLGVTWDGTGHGSDGTAWGGEFLLGDALGFERVAHLLPFRLPGGDAAAREPLRVAAALLHATDADGADVRAVRDGLDARMAPAQRVVLARMLETGLSAPITTSAGRLFDGVAALLGICTLATYEGEPAIALEQAAEPREHGAYELPFTGTAGQPRLLDWRVTLGQLCSDARRGVATGIIAARFHNALAQAIALQAEIAGCERVALTGGCFQNVLLLERTSALLRRRGFDVLLHRQVPPGDGGISLGQLVVATARIAAAADVRSAPTAALPLTVPAGA